jgi:hypothetical protein
MMIKMKAHHRKKDKMESLAVADKSNSKKGS